MQTLTLWVENKRVKKAQKVESVHLWYNPETKKLESYKCGKLSFVFDVETEKTKPVQEDIYINIYENIDNKKNIYKWINDYNDYVSINYDLSYKNAIAIDIEEKDVNYIKQSLDFAGIRYD